MVNSIRTELLWIVSWLPLCYLGVANDCAGEPPDELREFKIPDNAVEKEGETRLVGHVTKARNYVVGEELVGERYWYRNGRLAEERLFRNGRPHGYLKKYHANGKLCGEFPYRDGLLDGTCRCWDDKGKLLGESIFQRGTGTLHEYASEAWMNAEREHLTPYVNGEIHGTRREWSRQPGFLGRALQLDQYENGIQQGWSVTLDEDGKLMSSQFWTDGGPHGLHRAFDRDGNLRKNFPSYYAKGARVSEARFREAAETDPILKMTLTNDGRDAFPKEVKK